MSKSNKYSNSKKDTGKLADIFIIIGIVFLIGSLVLMFIKSDKDENIIKEITYNEYHDVISKDEYSIIILSTPTCSHCINYKPYVNYAANEYNLKVYNVNLQNLSYEEYVEIHDTYSATRNEFDSEGGPAIPTPCTLIVRDNTEISSILGDIGYNGFVNFLKENEVIK